MTSVNEIAPGVTRLGSRYVNWYLIAEGGRYTVIDGGLPRHFEMLGTALEARGASLDDVEAVVLTHGHGDHVGSTAHIVGASDASVHLHPAYRKTAAGEGTGPGTLQLLPWLLRPKSARFLLSLTRGGISRVPPVLEAIDLVDGGVIDVPGSPKIIHIPGHTAGSCVLKSGDTIFTGDALITANFLRGTTGPSLSPDLFNHDSTEAMASLTLLEGLGTAYIAPGHGEPWQGDLTDAVAAARRAGIR